MSQTTTHRSKNQSATLALAAIVSACQLVTDFARQKLRLDDSVSQITAKHSKGCEAFAPIASASVCRPMHGAESVRLMLFHQFPLRGPGLP